MRGKQEENRVCEEASGGTHATRKADRSSGEGKTSVTSAELQGWAKCFYFSKMLKTRLYMKLFKIIILAEAESIRT